MKGIKAFAAWMLCACLATLGGAAASSVGIIGSADGPTSIIVSAGAEGEAPEEAAPPTMHREIASDTLSMQVILGYDGAITYGKPIPLTVVVSNAGADLAGAIGVNVYQNSQYYDRYEMSVELPSGSSKRLVIPLTLSMKQATFTVELTAGGEVLCAVNAQPTTTVTPYAMLVGVLAPDTQSLSYLNLTVDRDELLRGETWQTVRLSQDAFPESEDLLRAFGILVFDAFDASILNDAQQAALDGWLKGGGILIVGGGAQASVDYPYFSRYTGLQAGPLVQAEDITPAIMRYVGMDGQALGQTFTLNAPTGSARALISAESPLVYQTPVGSGLIFTTTFELGAKPIVDWQTASTMWQRILLTAAPEAYSGRFYMQSYDESYWSAQNLLAGVRVQNDADLTKVYVVLAIFLLLSGFGAYFLLKRLDRRELLWGIVPLITVATAAVIFSMSNTTTLNRPMAVSVSSVRLSGEGVTLRTYAGVTSKERGGVVLSAEGADVAALSNTYYHGYFEDDMSGAKEPATRQYRFILGQNRAVEYPVSAPWTVNYLSVRTEGADVGAIRGSLWMEEDGLHAEIANDTAYAFEGGYLVTNLGYCSVPGLLPGQVVDASILRADSAQAETDSAASAAPASGQPMSQSAQPFQSSGSYAILDGQLIDRTAMAQSGYGAYYIDGSMVAQAIVYPEQQLDPSHVYTSADYNARSARHTLISEMLSSDEYGIRSTYIGFNDLIGVVRLSLDGEPIERTAHEAVVAAQVDFEVAGRTGIAYYMAGAMQLHAVQLGADGAPVMQGISGLRGFDLSGPQMFGFVLEGAEQVELERLLFSGRYVEGTCAVFFYNQRTGEWDHVGDNAAELVGPSIADYVGAGGELFVEAAMGDKNGYNKYCYIESPFVEAQGKVK